MYITNKRRERIYSLKFMINLGVLPQILKHLVKMSALQKELVHTKKPKLKQITRNQAY